MRAANDRVLDPSSGDGELLVSAVERLRELGVAPGLKIAKREWEDLGRSGKAVYMFKCSTLGDETENEKASAYVKDGEAKDYHPSYKCRICEPWYALRLPSPSQALMTHMVGALPRIVVNEAHLLSTNLAHRLDLNTSVTSPRAIAASFISTLTQVRAEVEGRSYGGGVLKIEPGDTRHLSVVVPSEIASEELEREFPNIDRLLRTGRHQEAVLLVDQIVLNRQLGLDTNKIEKLCDALVRLRERRL